MILHPLGSYQGNGVFVFLRKRFLGFVLYIFTMLIIICALLFPIKSSRADDTYTCWNCHSTNSRSHSANCSQCGWDICESCGACSVNCTSLKMDDQKSDSGGLGAAPSRSGTSDGLGANPSKTNTSSSTSETTYTCWNCHATYSRVHSTNCSLCGWDICESCGACSYDCVRSRNITGEHTPSDQTDHILVVFAVGALVLLIFAMGYLAGKKRYASKSEKKRL